MRTFRLRVEEPDGQVRDYPLTGSEITLGRASGGGIVVNHPSVSRRHLKFDVGQDSVTVEDLGSATGTFIRGRRVEAGTAVHLDPGEDLLFGDVKATLVVEAAGEGTVSPDTTPLTFAVHIEPPTAPVSAGSTATATIRIDNRAGDTDDYTIRIEDHPGAWIQVTRPHLSLSPGTSDDVTVVLRPPRTPEAAAGEHSFAVAVTSQRSQREVRSLASYTIERFENANLRLQPTRTRGSFRVLLTNEGNGPVRYSVRGEDQADELDFEFGQEVMEAEAGRSTSLNARTGPRRRRLFGHARTLRFSVVASPQESATASALTTAGQVEIRPPLRHWRSVLVALGGVSAVALAAGVMLTRGGGGLPSLPGGGRDTATATSAASASPTATAATSPTPTALPTATAEPEGLHKGGTALVTNSPENDCLLVREDHNRQSTALAFLCDGASVTLLSDRVEDDGHYWWKVDDGSGVQGWSAERAVGSDEVWLTLP